MTRPSDTTGIDAGRLPQAGPETEAGPLGEVDPINPKARAALAQPPGGLATLTVVVGFIGLVASLVVLGSVAEGVRSQEVFGLDTWATPFLHGIASPALDALMNALTTVGSNLMIIPIYVVAVAWLLWKRRYGAALFLTIAICGSVILDGTMKVFFQRPRPQLAWATILPDYSFPSGHTMNSVTFYGSLALLGWSVFGRRVGLVLVSLAAVLVFGVGASRIYLGYHYLTDVVGGVLAGIAWLLVVGAAFRARPTWRRWRLPRMPGSGTPDAPGRSSLEARKP